MKKIRGVWGFRHFRHEISGSHVELVPVGSMSGPVTTKCSRTRRMVRTVTPPSPAAVKHFVAIVIAVVATIVGASAFGISAVEYSRQVSTNRFTPSKADFRLNDHQRLREMLLEPVGRSAVTPR